MTAEKVPMTAEKVPTFEPIGSRSTHKCFEYV
jgi:hypothetical protein